jgi:hypothetical protein
MIGIGTNITQLQPPKTAGAYNFSDPLTYANGNLQDHTPWQYQFSDCPTLIGFMTSNHFAMQPDTVGSDGSAIMLGNAPIAFDWTVSCRFNSFVNTNQGRWCFGLVTYVNPGSVVSNVLGVHIRRVVNAGAVTLTAGGGSGWGAGVCGGSENNLPDNTVAAGDLLTIKTIRDGVTDNFIVDFFKNGVANGTGIGLGGGAGCIGGRPCLYSISTGGTNGILNWNDFSARRGRSANRRLMVI